MFEKITCNDCVDNNEYSKISVQFKRDEEYRAFEHTVNDFVNQFDDNVIVRISGHSYSLVVIIICTTESVPLIINALYEIRSRVNKITSCGIDPYDLNNLLDELYELKTVAENEGLSEAEFFRLHEILSQWED